MAVTREGALWVWGWNGGEFGGLGLGEGKGNEADAQLVVEEGVEEVAAGGVHTLVWMREGHLLVWGHNGFGQLGLGDFQHKTTPQRLDLPLDPPSGGSSEVSPSPSASHPARIASVGCGYNHSWVITQDGSLWIWGNGESGQLGERSENRNIPQKFPDLKFLLPRGSNEEKWDAVFRWMFLGRVDQDSLFRMFPVEVIFQALSVSFYHI
jgi:alpha-tubulin suppressor-like RCC1 family protein